MEINIKGYGNLLIENLLLDFNGTIAKDGKLIEGLGEIINNLAKDINVYVITADTNNSVREELEGLPIEVLIIDGNEEGKEKLEVLKELGEKVTVVVGNGNNDTLILSESILGISVIGEEGLSSKALVVSDIVVKEIYDALELLLKPKRMIATLRN